jgi:hypothetical protein
MLHVTQERRNDMRPCTHGSKMIWHLFIVAILTIITTLFSPSLNSPFQMAPANAASHTEIDQIVIRSVQTPNLSVQALLNGSDGSVSGTVTDEDTGLPIEGVEAWAWASESETSFGVCTGSDGSYTISGLPLDEPIYVGADSWYTCSGPANYINEYWEEASTFADATAITLTEGDPDETGIDFTLEAGYTVTGMVYETGGTTPIEDADITLEDFDSGQYIAGSRSQSDGSYSAAVPAGDYRVRAEADGYAFEFYDEAGQNGDDATRLEVSDDVEDVDFTLDPGGTISGQVTAQDGGAPLENIPVDADGIWAGDCTNSNGEFTLEGVALDTPFKVEAHSSDNWCGGPDNYINEYWEEVASWDDATPVTLTVGSPDATGIDFTLEEGYVVSGTVYEAGGSTPIQSASVNFEDYDSQTSMGSISTEEDGSYSIALPTGDYRVRAEADGYAFEFYDEAGQNGEDATRLAVSDDVEDVDFTLGPGGTISGRVTAEDGGAPLENIPVDASDAWAGRCTDSNGEYTLEGLALDTPFKVDAHPSDNWCGGSEDYDDEYWEEVASEEDATPITLTVGSPDATGIDFTLSATSIFDDVPVEGKEWMQDWIETFYDAGITTGCAISPLRYCPEREVTRAEMSVFILRALNYPSLPHTPPSQSGTFADVPVSGKEWMEDWIEEFYDEGITSGCAADPLRYCPEREVTRAEMAVFILRAVNGPGWTPPAQSGTFADVPVSGKEWMEPWIEAFYDAGITTGCAADPLRYCPEREVTRAEMAVFILRAFDNLPSVAGWSGANYSSLRVSPTPTPTATLTPTPTPTITPTPTATGTLTPTPTATETDVLTPTSTPTPSTTPSPTPTSETPEPTEEPTPEPTTETPEPTEEPTLTPTTETPEPTEEPTLTPTTETPEPTEEPTTETPDPGEEAPAETPEPGEG